MKILKKINWDIINDYLERDLLIMQKHPTKDLFILNYSKTCQYERAWDNVTLSCRGLVVDSDGNIVARCLKKFFNMEEYEAYEDLPNYPRDEAWEAYEKMDGSLGLLFYYEGEWIFTSRGSFISEQAIKGYDIFVKMFDGNFHFLDEQFTYIFEIIYPENRIVVSYGNEEDLVLLGAIKTSTGEEMSYEDMQFLYDDEDEEKIFTTVKRYNGIKDFDKMKSLNLDNKEGYVVRFSSGFRMKIKFEEYCRLHSIVTNVSNKIVWEHLKDGKFFEDMIENVPDEFYDWVEKTKNDLKNAYNEIEIECLRYYVKIQQELIAESNFQKKNFALKVKNYKYPSILFSMWDNKDYSDKIWKIIKPKYSKPFNDGIDES